MYESKPFQPNAPARRPAAGLLLDAGEVATLSALMRELRDVTLSRRSFSAASAFLHRLGGEAERPRLVPADPIDR